MKEVSNADLLATLVGRKNAKALGNKPLAELFGFNRPRQLNLYEPMEPYFVHPSLAAAKELFTRCMRERMEREDVCFSSPETTKTFLCSKIGHLEYESFWVLWVDSRRRLISAGELFRGTLNQVSVHPREIVKEGLAANASGLFMAHCHPSGTLEPSQADLMLTHTLKSTLHMVDIRVLDHFIIAGNQAMSFAERGLL